MEKELSRVLIPVPKIEQDNYDWYARHTAKTEAAAKHRYRAVFIGDSITHFWSADSLPNYGEGMWDDLYENLPALNLGFGFDRTQNVLWRLDHGEMAGQEPGLVVLNIGTNQFSVTGNYSGDDGKTAALGVLAVLKKLRTLVPRAKIVDMAIFPRGNGKQPFVAEANAVLRSEVPALGGVTFLDISDRLGDARGNPVPEYYQPDLCHLAVPGYRIWADALAPFIEELKK